MTEPQILPLQDDPLRCRIELDLLNAAMIQAGEYAAAQGKTIKQLLEDKLHEDLLGPGWPAMSVL
jgi:hypothetical protein